MNLVNLLEKKILLIDDDNNVVNLIEEVLIKEGFKNVIKADCGFDGIKKSMKNVPDVIVLDVMLPDIDGIEVCKKIREFSYCPILFLSCKNDEVDKILGLNIGGDDYITKPFSPKEVVFRIKAQLRRQNYDNSRACSTEKKLINVGSITISKENCQVFKNGNEINFTAKEYNLFLYFAENPNKIISKKRICENVWDEEYRGFENTITVHMRHIREKIEENPSEPKLLVTVIGLGYKLVNKDE